MMKKCAKKCVKKVKPLDASNSKCVKIVSKEGRSLSEMAAALSDAGFTSKTGVALTPSLVSKFRRDELGLRFVAAYFKPSYHSDDF
jgi:hypothetical protein